MTAARLVAFVLALLAADIAYAEDDLGRLFFTPAQRAALDAGKQINKPKADKRAARGRAPASITLNGVVVRSDGERTVWINGRAYQGRDPSGLRITPSAKTPAVAEIQVPQARKQVELRVGQTYRAGSGKITEAYESSVRRPGPTTPFGKDNKSSAGQNNPPTGAGDMPEQAPDN